MIAPRVIQFHWLMLYGFPSRNWSPIQISFPKGRSRPPPPGPDPYAAPALPPGGGRPFSRVRRSGFSHGVYIKGPFSLHRVDCRTAVALPRGLPRYRADRHGDIKDRDRRGRAQPRAVNVRFPTVGGMRWRIHRTPEPAYRGPGRGAQGRSPHSSARHTQVPIARHPPSTGFATLRP